MISISHQFGENLDFTITHSGNNPELNYSGNPNSVVLTPRTSLRSTEFLKLEVFWLKVPTYKK